MAKGTHQPGRISIFTDGGVRLGDWAAAAWFADTTHWGILGFRTYNSMAAEAAALRLAIESNPGALTPYTDHDVLVEYLSGVRPNGTMRHLVDQLADVKAIISQERDLVFRHTPGHGRHAAPETRFADFACRYGMVRLAHAASTTIHLAPADLPTLGRHALELPIDEAFARAAANRLLDLGIYDEHDPKHSTPWLDWRSGAFDGIPENQS
jgi:hypothetical protein